MSLPSSNASGQPSIRNFFRPKQPAYVAPPPSSAKDKQPSPSIPVPVPPPPPPPATIPIAATTTATAVPPVAGDVATTISPRPAGLHPQATISRIQPEHVPALRRITSLLLPVNYPDSFYARLSDPLSSGAFSRVILWRDEKKGPSASDKVIGGLVCRPEPSPFHAGTVDGPSANAPPPDPMTPSTQPNALYIQSLVLLSPYRGLGLAAALLDEVVADAARSEFACETVWAHVWTQNEEGLRWYMARGFARVEELKKYYYKLTPDSAWIVRREIGPGTLLGLGGPGSGVGAAGRRDLEAVEPGTSVTAAVANLPPLSTGPLSPASTAPPPSRPPLNPLPGSSSRGTPGQSFQNTRPETEWNDLPPDMQTSNSSNNNNNNNKAGSSGLSIPGSGASSRSSSAGRKKRDRAYPAAAFGN